MSHQVNTELYERASELIDQTLSHPAGIDKAIIDALANEDLDALVVAVQRAEAVLAQEHFAEFTSEGDAF